MSTARIAGVITLLVILTGLGVRAVGVDRGFDHRSVNAWREADYTQIARSFHREGMNIFYPRIDWREDKPGYAEMEFPALPWLAALSYHVVGYREPVLRILSYLVSVAALIVFALFARKLLPAWGALFATAAMAANGLSIYLSTAMQPEPLMLLLSLLAAERLWQWSETEDQGSLLVGCALLGVAIIAKSPAASLGLVVAYLVLARYGLGAFSQARVYVAAALALLPAVAWYGWAYHFYAEYGLSLGVSNESHWLSLDILRNPRSFVVGNIKAELRDVFAYVGLLLAAAALLQPWRVIRFPALWYGSVVVFYIATAATSGDEWALYYHSNSVAPACLLMGAGLSALLDRAAAAPGRAILVSRLGVAVLAVVLLLISAQRASLHLQQRDVQSSAFYDCMKRFAQHVPKDEKIVLRGGTKVDGLGHRVAYNESMAFAWMDRKGFNYAVQDFSLDRLEEIRQRGGRYWITKPPDLADQTIRAEIERRYERVQRCSVFALYDLEPGR